jgi:formylglycine-generating enzyme required for sulfatase activity
MVHAFRRSANALRLCVFVSLALGVAGCGGGGKGSGQPLGQGPGETARGSALVTMYWPEATRLVPAAANCVQISVSKSGGELIGTHNIARPASGFGTVSITFESLPAETVVFTAAAYPNSDATGTPQTRGSVSVQIKPNGSTDVNLTMGTTIARVGITPENPSVSVGNTVSLAATAYDSEDRIVLTSGTKWQWQLAAGGGVGTLTPNADRATFTGTAAGSATVTATEEESGKSSSNAVSVTASDPGYSGEMIYIPAGSFEMGTPDSYTAEHFSWEHPQHTVTLAAYSIGKYEVTRGQYRQFINAGGYSTRLYWSDDGWLWKGSRTEPQYDWDAVVYWGNQPFTQTDNHPVVGVSYYEAEAFCKWAGGDLPTEAQWERAARWTGTHANLYPWGDAWDAEKCNNTTDHLSSFLYQTTPVGSYPSGASPSGCQDMAGNALEWCKDWYSGTYYSTGPTSDPQGPASGEYGYRVQRGGSYIRGVMCASRHRDHPSIYSNSGEAGFRLAR